MKRIYFILSVLLATTGLSAQNSKPYFVGPKTAQCVPGQTTCLSIQTMDEDAGDTVRISWNSGVQTATFTNNNGTVKHASGEICWTPQNSDTSRTPYPFYVIMDDGKEQVTDTLFVFVRGLPERLSYSTKLGTCGAVSLAITANDWTSSAGFVLRDSLNNTIASDTGWSVNFNVPKGFYRVFTTVWSTTPSIRTYLDTLIVSEGIAISKYKQAQGQGNYSLTAEVRGEDIKSYAWYKLVNGNKEDLQLSTETIQVNTWNTETFRVYVTANSGCMDSADFEFQANPNGLKTINHQANAFPNPANQSLTIQLPEGQLVGIQVWTLDGKLIQENISFSTKEYQLDTSKIPDGLYLITCLREDGSKEYIRVVISH